MLFSTMVGVGVTLSVSSVAQSILTNNGKRNLAETLNVLTKLGVLSYAAYFLWNLFQVLVSSFL